MDLGCCNSSARLHSKFVAAAEYLILVQDPCSNPKTTSGAAIPKFLWSVEFLWHNSTEERRYYAGAGYLGVVGPA